MSLTEPPEAACALMAALDLFHAPTARHARAVADACQEICAVLRLAPADRGNIVLAGLLHDIGKLATPPAVLDATDVLTEYDNSVVRASVEHGEHLLQSCPTLHAVAPLVAAHLEWWNGSGYPRGLSGEQIPLGSRIVAIAHTYAARRCDGAITDSAAGLYSGAGTRFDPAIVDAAVGPRNPVNQFSRIM